MNPWLSNNELYAIKQRTPHGFDQRIPFVNIQLTPHFVTNAAFI